MMQVLLHSLRNRLGHCSAALCNSVSFSSRSSNAAQFPKFEIIHSVSAIQSRKFSRSHSVSIQKTGHTETVIPSISEKDYHIIADSSLEEIMDRLTVLEDIEELEDLDVNYSMGVLNITLGAEHGTWVINKQTPNRQLWWSSPLSGPRRYELQRGDEGIADLLDEEGQELVARWRHTKHSKEGGGDGGGSEGGDNDILQALREELLEQLGVDIMA